MTMLDPDQIDLGDLTHALQDHSEDHEWWLDASSGELVLWSELLGDELDEGHPEERGLVFVEPVPSQAAGPSAGSRTSCTTAPISGRIGTGSRMRA